MEQKPIPFWREIVMVLPVAVTFSHIVSETAARSPLFEFKSSLFNIFYMGGFKASQAIALISQTGKFEKTTTNSDCI